MSVQCCARPGAGAKSLLAGSVLAAAVAAICLAVPVQAQQKYYAGIAVGQSTFKDANTSCDELGFDPGCSFSVDDKDTAPRIFGGVQFHPNFAAEIGYVNLGATTLNGLRGTVAGNPSDAGADFKASGFDFSVLGSMPLGMGIGGSARLGLFAWNAKSSATGTIAGIPVSGSESANGMSALFGLGLTYDFARVGGLRLELTRYQNVGDEDTTGEGSIDLLSVSGLYRF